MRFEVKGLFVFCLLFFVQKYCLQEVEGGLRRLLWRSERFAFFCRMLRVDWRFIVWLQKQTNQH